VPRSDVFRGIIPMRRERSARDAAKEEEDVAVAVVAVEDEVGSAEEDDEVGMAKEDEVGTAEEALLLVAAPVLQQLQQQ